IKNVSDFSILKYLSVFKIPRHKKIKELKEINLAISNWSSELNVNLFIRPIKIEKKKVFAWFSK
mgnify:CR=1